MGGIAAAGAGITENKITESMNIKKKLPVILQLEHKVRLVLAYQKILGSGNSTLSSAIHVIFPETATVPVQYVRNATVPLYHIQIL